MEKLLADVSTPYWWFSVVVLSLVLNLVSSYIKKPVDAVLEKIWSRYKESQRRKNDAFLRDALAVSHDSDDMRYLAHRELRTLILGVFFLLFGFGIIAATVTFLISSNPTAEFRSFFVPVLMGAGLAQLAVALYAFKKAQEHAALLEQALDFKKDPPLSRGDTDPASFSAQGVS